MCFALWHLAAHPPALNTSQPLSLCLPPSNAPTPSTCSLVSTLLQFVVDEMDGIVVLGEGSHSIVLLGWMHGARVAVKVGGATHLGAGMAGVGHHLWCQPFCTCTPIPRIVRRHTDDIPAAAAAPPPNCLRRCLSCCPGWTAGSFGGRPSCNITASTTESCHCMGRPSRWVRICGAAMCFSTQRVWAHRRRLVERRAGVDARTHASLALAVHTNVTLPHL
jgi:hypothetical protein